MTAKVNRQVYESGKISQFWKYNFDEFWRIFFWPWTFTNTLKVETNLRDFYFFEILQIKKIDEKKTMDFFILEKFALYKIRFQIGLTNLPRDILYRRRAFHTIRNITW